MTRWKVRQQGVKIRGAVKGRRQGCGNVGGREELDKWRCGDFREQFHAVRDRRRQFFTLLLYNNLILARLRAVAATRWSEWLQSQVATLIQDQAEGSSTGGEASPRAQRLRPLERFSPGPSSRAQRHSRSPLVDPSVPPVKRTPASTGGPDGILAIGEAWGRGYGPQLPRPHIGRQQKTRSPRYTQLIQGGDPAGEEQRYMDRATP